jgi:hypothetical protein
LRRQFNESVTRLLRRLERRFEQSPAVERRRPVHGRQVNNWRAEASGGGNVNLGGPASEGCGYLFHTSKRFLSISGAWSGKAIRWDVPPTVRGSWSPQQQAASADNATVDADGLLSTG